MKHNQSIFKPNKALKESRSYTRGSVIERGTMKPYKSVFKETCPETATPKGGKYAKADNSGYLKGVCNKGHTWDKAHDKCVPMAKEAISEAEYGFARPNASVGFDYERDKKIIEAAVDKAYELMQGIRHHLEMYPYSSHSKDAVREVEYKSRDGFWSHIDGGFEATGFVRSLSELTYGHPKAVTDAANKRQKYNYQIAKEQFIQEYPELVEELGKDKINYHDLYEAGYDSEAERLSEMEMEMEMESEDDFMFQLRVLYYSPNNTHSDFDGQHSVHVDAVVNWEAPYYRSGKGNEFIGFAKSFVFKDAKQLEKILKAALQKAAKSLFK